MAAYQGIDLPHQAIEDLAPVLVDERIGQFLSRLGVVEGREGVVLLGEPQLVFEHLLSQPGVAVDVDLDGEREPVVSRMWIRPKSGSRK